jgi:hemoglobin
MTDAAIASRETQPPTPFQQLGGIAGVRALVDRFYDLMDLEPDFAELRALHPPTLDGSRDKFAWFLTGWLGGPDLYIERFGHPRLRARHLPYPIGLEARDQWLACMGLAMAEIGEAGGFTPAMQERLMISFANTADHMRNRAG